MKGIFFADFYFKKSHIYVCMTYHILSYVALLIFYPSLLFKFFAASFRIQSDHSTPQYLTKSNQTRMRIPKIQMWMAQITNFDRSHNFVDTKSHL